MVLGKGLGKESRPGSWRACCPWRALSFKCLMNGRPEDWMPISIEIMLVAGYYATRDRRHQAERANVLCGYEEVAKEQLCPLDFGILSGFFVLSLKSTSCHFLMLFLSFWGPLTSWLNVQMYPALNCSSSILVMMGPVVMSWWKISGCSQWHGLHDTFGWVCGDSFAQVQAHGKVGQSTVSLPDTGGHLSSLTKYLKVQWL